MNIEFSKEELTAIAQNDYSIFDHELSAYELKAAITAIVTELTSSEPITALKNEIQLLKETLELQDHKFRMADRLNQSRSKTIGSMQQEIDELRHTIFCRERALEEWQKKAGDLEKEKAALQTELDEWEAQHAAVSMARRKAAYYAER